MLEDIEEWIRIYQLGDTVEDCERILSNWYFPRASFKRTLVFDPENRDPTVVLTVVNPPDVMVDDALEVLNIFDEDYGLDMYNKLTYEGSLLIDIGWEAI